MSALKLPEVPCGFQILRVLAAHHVLSKEVVEWDVVKPVAL